MNVNTVLNVYGHLLEGTDEAAAERIGERIASYSRPEAVDREIVFLLN